MSERGTQGGESKEEERSILLLLLGRLLSAGGVFLGLIGTGVALFEPQVVIPAATVGIFLGMGGYLLGSRWLGIAALVLAVVAMIFGIAVTQGMIPGLESIDPISE
ncbi:MAG: hypothetical protein H0T05_01230 [Acidobacteria bacterium]|jgi:hypothetical protein|nr:hypothetical protein [Acidobacteriota bacterium]